MKTKKYFHNETIYLYLFFICLILLYLNTPLIQFIFLLPLLHYLKNTKKINYLLISILISVTSIINFLYFKPYGEIFLMYVILANILFYMTQIIIYKYLIDKKHFFISIPIVFFIQFYLFHQILFNNFWLNFSALLKYYPISIQYLGSFITTFLLILFNTVLYYLIINFNQIKKNINILNKIQIITIIIFILLILNFFLFILKNPNSNQNDREIDSIKIAGIQSNLKQNWFERFKNYEKNRDIYLNLSEKAIEKYNPDLIIWPEYVFSHPIEFDLETQDIIQKFSKKNNITIILGSIKLESPEKEKSKRFNTIFIFKGDNISTHSALEPVTLLDKEVAKEKFNSKINIKNTNIGISLCYEENFPYIASNQINKDNSEILLTIGNQYYIDNEKGLKLTSLSSNLRAVETNRYLFRLETSGFSTVINNYGQNIKSIPMNEENILYYEIPKITKKTFYTNHRNQIEIIFLIIISVILSIIFLKHNNN